MICLKLQERITAMATASGAEYHTSFVMTLATENAMQMELIDAAQAIRLFLYGQQNRQTAATLFMWHQCSSRSHSVFTIKLVSYAERDVSKMLRSVTTDDDCSLQPLRVNEFSIWRVWKERNVRKQPVASLPKRVGCFSIQLIDDTS